MIRHHSGRFFQIACRNSDTGPEPVIIQNEIGTLCWLKNPDSFVAMMKFEPGNIISRQMTCTIQATQSNIDRIHNGKSTPLIDNIGGWSGTLQTEYESKCPGKMNRNGIVYLEYIPLGAASCNVELLYINPATLLDHVMTDLMTTGDARSSLVCSEWCKWLPKCSMSFDLDASINSDSTVDMVGSVEALRQYRDISKITDIDMFGNRVVWVSVKSDEREIDEWCQPLLNTHEVGTVDLLVSLKKPIRIGLSIRQENHGPVYDVQQIDVASSSSHKLLHSSWQSDEGGRFWKECRLYRILSVREMLPGFVWLPLGVVQRLLLKDRVVTGDARSAICLFLAWLSKQ
jgi:hypothetical protein